MRPGFLLTIKRGFSMNSIRTKTTVLTVCAIIASLTIATLLGVMAVKKVGSSSSDQILHLMCETGQKNLDAYFESVEQSLEMVASYVESDLQEIAKEKQKQAGPEADEIKDDRLTDAELAEHVRRARDLFGKAAYGTNGVLTYYYRIDPSASKKVKGFWFTNLDGNGFVEHEPTDITQYDTNDTSQLVWFTVPKSTGKPVWLPPYITDNLDKRVISYNVPIYCKDEFIGVAGIEIDYSTMAEQVDNITLYENGYAFINDDDGNIIYHPKMDVAELEKNMPKAPEGLLSDNAYIEYTYDGVKKEAVWLPLSNGMRLNVTVPIAEIDRDWETLIYEMLIVALILLFAFILLTLRFTTHITRPLQELTEAAQQVNEGNYDFSLEYDDNDEVGLLTQTFNSLTQDLKVYISDLNDLAYADALTSVHNKGAFDIYVREMEQKLEETGEKPAFAIGVFDCDGLKSVNDHHGHDKGDIYLQNACRLICNVFRHSPVFRTGGDEFTMVLQNDDYRNREELAKLFETTSAELCDAAENRWEQVRVAWGIADYDPERDESVIDVVKRADRLMYDNKRLHKETQAGAGKAEEKPASDEPAIDRQTNKEPADAESE